jgi:hypothetical protein
LNRGLSIVIASHRVGVKRRPMVNSSEAIQLSFVMAGLDQAIHLLRKRLVAKKMDTRAFASPRGLRPRRRVKPAYDAFGFGLLRRKGSSQ